MPYGHMNSSGPERPRNLKTVRLHGFVWFTYSFLHSIQSFFSLQSTMILSKACTYGVLAALYVTREASRSKDFVSIGRMSKELNISFHFLTKILQQLTAAGIMVSMKGPKGGVAMKTDPHKISLADVVVAIDGVGLFADCLLGLPGCGEEKPCPLHEDWAGIRDRLFQTFRDKSLAETAHRIDELNLRFTLPDENGAGEREERYYSKSV